MKFRKSVHFDAEALRVLGRLQEADFSPSRSKVVRDALAFSAWALEELENGRCVGSFAIDGSSVREELRFWSSGY